MTKQNDEISSTERLLSLIRGKTKADQKVKAPTIAAPPSSARGTKPKVAKVLAFKKRINVGVDIGYESLKLIKVRQYSGK